MDFHLVLKSNMTSDVCLELLDYLFVLTRRLFALLLVFLRRLDHMQKRLFHTLLNQVRAFY